METDQNILSIFNKAHPAVVSMKGTIQCSLRSLCSCLCLDLPLWGQEKDLSFCQAQMHSFSPLTLTRRSVLNARYTDLYLKDSDKQLLRTGC